MWERIGRSCRWLALPMVMLVMSACDHKDLVFEVSNAVTVNFDWSECPSASPSAMRLAVFEQNARTVFIPANGHENAQVELENGRYQFVAYNSDTEVLHSRGSDYNNFEIFSQEADIASFTRIFTRTLTLPRAKGTEGETFIEEPDPLWASALDRVTIPGASQIRMPMKSAIVRYTFTISNVENLDNVRAMAATVSGMSESYYPSRDACSESFCTIPFSMERSGTSEITGSVRTFGYWTEGTGDAPTHKLVMYVETADGTKVYYTFDVTSLIEKASETVSDTGDIDVDVEIKNLPLPEPITNGSGLHPMVDTWREVEIEIDL